MAHPLIRNLAQAEAYVEDSDPAHLVQAPKLAFGVLAQVQAQFAAAMDASNESIVDTIGIAVRTLARRKAGGIFETAEAERILRVIRLRAEAARMLGADAAKATRWMVTPKRALGGLTPLKAANTEKGALQVSRLIGQVMHGVLP